jgi:hypothetical protein
MIFWRLISFDYADWDKPVQKSASNWARSEAKLKDTEALEDTVAEAWQALENFVLNTLSERWPAPSVTEQSSTDKSSRKE